MEQVIFVEGGWELLERTAALWERLNAHHARVNPDFEALFAGRDFAWRLAKWRAASGGGLRAWLALAGDDPVGFAVAAVDAAGAGELATLFVEEAWRGRGLGRELAERCLAWLEGRSVGNVSLEVVGGNAGAVAFYETLGFRVRKLRMERVAQAGSPPHGVDDN
ncbi:Ribosomal-protein-alanine acetyltransferase [Fundidesulfovibrio magnetotacticus]|uniref:Ribosomal-protein-alanine acetyltransferase n=1 Tax=Fundidesulfovibrio magnetotacticus TaxID=2730080 RepID=A0A6V8LQ66_9BACT|nr:GNAT family N-acetyltransferase [Fundidesulfovibrio magnetotacticus]GFK94673.1 Ribosomal-protein-alanine acetyltransferase [Fundidesulfovibrio magnetotacticus]